MPDDQIKETQPQAETPVTTGEQLAGDQIPETPHVDEPPDPGILKAEIEELIKKREKAEVDAKYWREQKARERAEFFRERGQPPSTPSPPKPQELQEPKLADFDDYDKYVGALADFRADQKIKAWEIDRAQKQAQQSQQEKMVKFSEKLQQGTARYEDFEQIITDPTAVHMNNMVVGILMELDNPADVAYYLAKNRPEGVAISRMTPYQAMKAISKIEADIAKTLATNPTSIRSTTNAPPPIIPVGARETGTKDPEKMSGKEYEKWLKEKGVRLW